MAEKLKAALFYGRIEGIYFWWLKKEEVDSISIALMEYFANRINVIKKLDKW